MNAVSDETQPASGPHWGRLQIALAAALWSTSGFFAKAPWFEGWPVDSRGLQIAFWRGLFGFLALVPFIRRPEFRWPMIPMVVCFAIMVWTFMSAMIHGPAANAIWLQYLCPAWVLLAGKLFLREPVTAGDAKMFVCCLSGVALMLGCELIQGTGIYATVLGITSGVMLAGVMLSMRALRGVDAVWLIAISQLGSALLVAPLAWQTHVRLATGSYVALAFFGIIQMSIPYMLFARGLRTTPSPEASILALIEPILVPVWVFLAWHHHASYVAPPWWTYAGGTLITLGLLSRYLPAMRRSLKAPITIRPEEKIT